MDADQLGLFAYIVDYLHHLVLPVISLTLASFAFMTMLTKNNFLDELHKLYVMTARAKGLVENRVLYGHVFRNAMLIPLAGFPRMFIMAFFTGSFTIEIIFSIRGMGQLGFTALLSRDYPIMFSVLYLQALLGLLVHILSDFLYTVIDPRIDFEKRG